ncbi:MAG: TIGR01212 family radical SAM protein [Candidatus Schekmanbacteria bacterium]|nr:TIGR01212 family radical SAM protein [Candidatus Schekmanbacteria bacterium]
MRESKKMQSSTQASSLKPQANYVPPLPYNDFNTHLRRMFNCRVQKIPLSAGFTCPNRDGRINEQPCIYCDEHGSAAWPNRIIPPIRQQMTDGIRRVEKKYPQAKFMAYFQAFSNTYAPVETLHKLYTEALETDRRVIGLAVGTRPDCLSDQIWELLTDLSRRYYFWLELGLQSAYNKTLQAICRGHNRKQFTDAVQKAHSLGIRVCAHVILGLPGESKRHMMRTANYLNALGIEGIKLHNLYILQNTKLAELYTAGLYRPLELNEYAGLTAEFLARLSPNVIIQRLVSDPPVDRLIAPLWAANKGEILNAVRDKMWEDDLRQGILLI